MDLTMRLVERLKGVAVKVGTEGLRMVVDGTVAAVKVMDRLQELLPDNEWLSKLKRETSWGAASPETRPLWEREPQLERPTPVRPVRSRPVQPRVARPPPEEVRETAQRVLAEVEAVQGRLKRATPAKRPLKVMAEMEEEATPKRRRTSGRKTSPLATTSAKRVTAPKEGGFKAKRGQKHRH
jgi:hypothetical protein